MVDLHGVYEPGKGIWSSIIVETSHTANYTINVLYYRVFIQAVVNKKHRESCDVCATGMCHAW